MKIKDFGETYSLYDDEMKECLSKNNKYSTYELIGKDEFEFFSKFGDVDKFFKVLNDINNSRKEGLEYDNDFFKDSEEEERCEEIIRLKNEESAIFGENIDLDYGSALKFKRDFENFDKEYIKYLDGKIYSKTFILLLEPFQCYDITSNGTVVGFISFDIQEENGINNLYVKFICIKELSSGNGIGKSTILSLIKNFDCKVITGEIIDADDGFTHNFWSSIERNCINMGISFEMTYD